jgi:hypothetical protein
LTGAEICNPRVRRGVSTTLSLSMARDGSAKMHVLALVIFWVVLAAVCWPLALLAIVLMPLVWLISLPFRVLGICVEALLALIKALLFLPARILGYRR